MLTKHQVKNIPKGQIILVSCANKKEMLSYARTAYKAMAEAKMKDLKISYSSKTLTLTIRHL